MNIEKLNEIEKKIEHLKVIGYNEEEVIANSNFISLIKGEYTLNNNKTIYRDKVVKNVGTGNAVCVFAITKENNIILVIQPRPVINTENKVSIELPAGYIENKEDAIKAAKRELKEETGYTSDEVIYLDSYFPSQGASGENISLTIALNCTKTKKQSLDKDEFLEYIEVDFNEFEYLINNGYMIDANSRIAYYKVREYLEKELTSKVVEKLIAKNKTIATMESCTGGYIANMITNIPDASKVLKYSAVTYSNEYKIKMGVSSKVIDKYSVYSIECANEMAYNISKYANSDYGIGITGTLKKYDENNKSTNNDLVYLSIYDKNKDKYYNKTIKVYSDNRENNKIIIGLSIMNLLIEIMN